MKLPREVQGWIGAGTGLGLAVVGYAALGVADTAPRPNTGNETSHVTTHTGFETPSPLRFTSALGDCSITGAWLMGNKATVILHTRPGGAAPTPLTMVDIGAENIGGGNQVTPVEGEPNTYVTSYDFSGMLPDRGDLTVSTLDAANPATPDVPCGTVQGAVTTGPFALTTN